MSLYLTCNDDVRSESPIVNTKSNNVAGRIKSMSGTINNLVSKRNVINNTKATSKWTRLEKVIDKGIDSNGNFDF